jgi:spermidine synthase
MKAWLESFLTSTNRRKTLTTDSAYIFETEKSRSLYFDSRWVQSMMQIDAPDTLALEYTQMMMGFLLLNPEPERIALIGLGGGSIAKYCLKHLPDISLVAVEINQDVLSLRSHFCIPPDNRKFRVVHADGADFVQHRNQPKFDVIMLDAFDAVGLPPTMGSQGFYDHCFARLQDGGVLVANFPDGDGKFGTYAARIRESFDDQVISIQASDDGNKILFALKGGSFPPTSALLQVRAIELNKTHTVDFPAVATKISGRLQQRPMSVINRLITAWPSLEFRSPAQKSPRAGRRKQNEA